MKPAIRIEFELKHSIVLDAGNIQLFLEQNHITLQEQNG